MAHIRPYEPKDEAAIIHIFRETAANDLRQAGDPALNTGSYIWARPYIQLTPSHCFVLADNNNHDTAVGYILACPDTTSFVKSYNDTYLPQLEKLHGITKSDLNHIDNPTNYQEDLLLRNHNTDHGGLSMDIIMRCLAYLPEQMLVSNNPSLIENYPAHLHIDILESHQRRGYGRELVSTLCEKLRQEGVKGVHLGMVGSNEGAKLFCRRLGFDRFGEVMDGGFSGEVGVTGDGGCWFVKRLS